MRSFRPFADRKVWELEPGNSHNGMVGENQSAKGKRGIDGVPGSENVESRLTEWRESRTESFDLGVS